MPALIATAVRPAECAEVYLRSVHPEEAALRLVPRQQRPPFHPTILANTLGGAKCPAQRAQVRYSVALEVPTAWLCLLLFLRWESKWDRQRNE